MRNPTLSSRRGNYAIIFAFCTPLILGAGALAVDLTLQKVVRAELQAVADIASAAGTDYLDGTAQGLNDARSAAMRAAARNTAYGQQVLLSPENIEFGYWDEDDWYFVTSTDPEEIDAMRLVVHQDNIMTNFAETFEWPLIQHRSMEARARSTSQQPPPMPAGAVACYIPLGIADCLFEEYTQEELDAFEFNLNPAGIDNVGWARVDGSPSASWASDQINDCQQDGWAWVGDDLGLANGVITSTLGDFATAIEGSQTSWNPEWGAMPAQKSGSAVNKSYYGRTFEGPIPVFDGGPEYCLGSGGSFNGTEQIVGFAWAVIYDVKTSGAAETKNVWLRLNMMAEEDYGKANGGLVDAGVNNIAPATVVE